MDRSVHIELFKTKTHLGQLELAIVVPNNKNPLPFKEACASLRKGWDTKNLGYKIRAMQAIALETTRSLGISGEPPKLLIPAEDTAISSAEAEFVDSIDAVIFRLDSLSADKVTRIIPHEYFHSCQFKFAHLLTKNASLVSAQNQQKVGEWFATEYVSAYNENTLGYLTQPIESDAFKFTVDFAKKHDLPLEGALSDLAAVKLAKRKSTQEIVADPKKHLYKLAAVVTRGNPYIATYKPGGHIVICQKMNGMGIYGVQAFRKDEALNDNPSLSNIIAHLAHEKTPLDVAIMLPGRATNKAMCGHLAIAYKNELYVHPRYILEGMTPADITEDKIKRLDESHVVKHPKGVREELKNARQKANMDTHKKNANLSIRR